MARPILILNCWRDNPLVRPHIRDTHHQAATIIGSLYRSSGGDPLFCDVGHHELPATLIKNAPPALLRVLTLLLTGPDVPGPSPVQALLFGSPVNATTWVCKNPIQRGALRIKTGRWHTRFGER